MTLSHILIFCLLNLCSVVLLVLAFLSIFLTVYCSINQLLIYNMGNHIFCLFSSIITCNRTFYSSLSLLGLPLLWILFFSFSFCYTYIIQSESHYTIRHRRFSYGLDSF
ncbi:hypothetical protein DFH05DRAFT_626233 [Lentinula detonsa]|uniref:Uncharacterized protein n=1 Tax=Lentinula detonsa TaxID=2804962 RepID=A0A9W8P8H3_9AGAR|nr:hypothetical protein DFH05DRAFT_626233 [Lentinula detonsa]